MRASSADVGPYRVHWVESGVGAETVVLIHGLSGSSRWWQRNVPALAAKYRVVVPDLIGFGRSRCPGPLPAMPAVADLFARWMEVARTGPVHLVGHSMGGHLAVHVAARHPELIRRLVLVDAAGLPRPLTMGALVRFVYELAPPKQWGDPAFLPVIWGDAFTAGPLAVAQGLRNVLRDDVRPLLPKLTAPTLVLWGTGDTIVPLEHARIFRDTIPGARLALIPSAFHNPMVDQPEAFNRLLVAFLAGEQVGE
jgi:pimeloyl-ACP methyl ester carboxylesterase